jgi:hypothetical protein
MNDKTSDPAHRRFLPIEVAIRHLVLYSLASANDNRSDHSWVNRAVVRERSGAPERK